jgi:hypothetical protein
VQLKTELSSSVFYATAGYRADCSNIAFKEVITINHATNEKAWFKQASPKSIKMSATDYNVPGSTYGLWNGYGAATNSYNYQLNICDSGPGLMLSGFYNSCYKQCFEWCSDLTTAYFRLSGALTGVAWNELGHEHLSKKLVSFGIRG